jgi:hypothetical protein
MKIDLNDLNNVLNLVKDRVRDLTTEEVNTIEMVINSDPIFNKGSVDSIVLSVVHYLLTAEAAKNKPVIAEAKHHEQLSLLL